MEVRVRLVWSLISGRSILLRTFCYSLRRQDDGVTVSWPSQLGFSVARSRVFDSSTVLWASRKAPYKSQGEKKPARRLVFFSNPAELLSSVGSSRSSGRSSSRSSNSCVSSGRSSRSGNSSSSSCVGCCRSWGLNNCWCWCWGFNYWSWSNNWCFFFFRASSQSNSQQGDDQQRFFHGFFLIKSLKLLHNCCDE